MTTKESTPSRSSRTPALWLAGLFLLALLVRAWRLDWQPLWWDEGYSVYFATEGFGRMLWLTAHDIHPPLYYALLELWYLPFGGPAPVALRLFSVSLGAASVPALWWAARQFYTTSPRVAWIAAILLAISPMHLYYSQEVRMYALATLFAILATALFWKGVQEKLAGAAGSRTLWLYAVCALLLLYTLYYGALLLLAHAIWAAWVLWQRRGDATTGSVARQLGVIWLAVLALYLPWLIYALPKLIPYIEQKVASDQDVALSPLAYVVRHLNAFLAGHVQSAWGLERWAALLGVVGIALLTFALVLTTRSNAASGIAARKTDVKPLEPAPALTCFLLIPFLAAFLISLVNPFFPEGGERLLLFVLPFALLLVARGIDLLVARLGVAGWTPALPLLAAAAVGIYVFYITPRHVQEDYRSLLADVAHNGHDQDSLVAIFPWQVGYWRAYKPRDIAGPVEYLLGDLAVEYSPEIEQEMERLLEEGTLWFPEPLAFGSDLPPQLESWLATNAANIENRWYSLTTRLTAWAALDLPRPSAPAALFGDLTLMASGVGEGEIAADNTPLPVTLLWDQAALAEGMHGVTLRLQDGLGRTWASRGYAPVGAFAREEAGELPLVYEHLGLPIPPGTPPGEYRLMLGVTDGDQLVKATSDDGQSGLLIDLGAVSVVNPHVPPPPGRFEMGTQLRTSATSNDLTVLGYTTPVSPTLAGTEMAVTLFVRAENAQRNDSELLLYLAEDEATQVRLRPPLPDYPTSQWQQGLTLIVPVRVRLSPWLASGSYRLNLRWLDAATGEASAPLELGRVEVVQRPSVDAATPAVALAPNPQFGTHALLRGYTTERSGDIISLALTWEVLQPILPEHNIFVHLDTPQGDGSITVAQGDGEPQTIAGSAPTSTWRPGETITTLHEVVVPADFPADEWVLRVGLYDPVTEGRLPVSIDGATAGDNIEIPIEE